jgi:glycosyltransferase involved in cell wall biosynthesis
MKTAPEIQISVVMPVFDGRRHLERSLPPLLAGGKGSVLEVIVVDDGSGDGSGEYARASGARVIPSGGTRLGPGRARNVGVAEASGEVLLFVDADVVLHEDALERIAEAFEEQETTAVYGSYDASPPHRGFGSQYMNLRHHFVHQQPTRDSTTFWAGIGAVRREAFLAVGGFDSEAYPRPSIEDIELGMRLRSAGGRIRRMPEIRGTHLKEWSLREVVRVDIFRRAWPWSRLMLRHPGVFVELNVNSGERVKALLAAAFLASLLAVLLPGVPFWIPAVLLLGAWWANRRLIGLFAHRNGLVFALAGLLFHQLYYVYSSVVYAWCVVEAWVHREPDASG